MFAFHAANLFILYTNYATIVDIMCFVVTEYTLLFQGLLDRVSVVTGTIEDYLINPAITRPTKVISN